MRKIFTTRFNAIFISKLKLAFTWPKTLGAISAAMITVGLKFGYSGNFYIEWCELWPNLTIASLGALSRIYMVPFWEAFFEYRLFINGKLPDNEFKYKLFDSTFNSMDNSHSGGSDQSTLRGKGKAPVKEDSSSSGTRKRGHAGSYLTEDKSNAVNKRRAIASTSNSTALDPLKINNTVYWKAQHELFLNAISAKNKLASGIELTQDERDAYYHLKRSNMLSDLELGAKESYSNYIERIETNMQAEVDCFERDYITSNIKRLKSDFEILKKDLDKYRNSEYSDTLKTKIRCFEDRLEKVKQECANDLADRTKKK